MAPSFQPTYTYAYAWPPGHIGRMPFVWGDQEPVGEVIGQWAGSGDLLYFPQSRWLYLYYPPAMNPCGPGQLDGPPTCWCSERGSTSCAEWTVALPLFAPSAGQQPGSGRADRRQLSN